MDGLDESRQDQIVPAALLVGELFRRLDLKRMQWCPGALREGMLVDYLSRHLPDLVIRRDVPDPRHRSVLDLARRCDWHESHSLQVTRLAMLLFDQLKPLHRLGPAARQLIQYGAMLHDIGWHISRKAHHKHSMYLILNGELKGFGPEEIQTIANIARYHRKAPPRPSHVTYAGLPRRFRRIVDVGAAIVRIADGLDRSHSSAVTSIRTRVTPDQILLRVDGRGDVAIELWAARSKCKWFAKVFDRPVMLREAST
jgi:exopolyphosphatase/guanosine-5'-triphosphate,3'-diphosphate pyrophosphatase